MPSYIELGAGIAQIGDDGSYKLVRGRDVDLITNGTELTSGNLIGDDVFLVDDGAAGTSTKYIKASSLLAYINANISTGVSGDTFATDLKIGRDAHNHIDFTADNKIVFRVNDVERVIDISGSDSNIISKYDLELKNDSVGSESSILKFNHDSASPAQHDRLGSIQFYGNDSGGTQVMFGEIRSTVVATSATDYAGSLKFYASRDGASTGSGLAVKGRFAEDVTDIDLGYGATSLTTVAGTLTMGSTATLDNNGLIQVAGQTNITSLGTLTSLDVDDINLNNKTIKITGSTDDYFQIATTTAGRTTLTTHDQDSAGGHFEIQADGNITLDSTGDVIIEAGSGTYSNDATTANFTSSTLNTKNVVLAGNFNSTFNTDGSALHVGSMDITDNDTAGSGTVATYNHVAINNPRLLATNSNVTTTNASTLFIKGAPVGHTNQTITNGWALRINAGNVDLGSGTHKIGTIGTGTWNGSVIASAYLDPDTAHLSGNQTFTGTKTFNDIEVVNSNSALPSVMKFYEASQLGSDSISLQVPVSGLSGNKTINLPSDTGTLALTSDITAAFSTETTSNVVVTNDDGSTSLNHGIVFVPGTNSSNSTGLEVATGFTFNPNTNTLQCQNFNGTASYATASKHEENNDNASYGLSFTTVSTGTSTPKVNEGLLYNPGARTLKLLSSLENKPTFTIENTHNSAGAGELVFSKLRADDGVAQGDNIGEILFDGQDSAQNSQRYAYMVGEIDVGTSGQESGQLKFGVASHDGGTYPGLTITGGSSNNAVDVTIGGTTSSAIQINGDTQVSGDITTTGSITPGAVVDAQVHGVKGSSRWEAQHVTATNKMQGDIIYAGTTTNTTAGLVYYLKSDGTWEKAKATSSSYATGLLALATGTDSSKGMLVKGIGYLSADCGSDTGTILFLSDDNAGGKLTGTKPSTSGHFIRTMGYVLKDAGFEIYFNPDSTFIELD